MLIWSRVISSECIGFHFRIWTIALLSFSAATSYNFTFYKFQSHYLLLLYIYFVRNVNELLAITTVTDTQRPNRSKRLVQSIFFLFLYFHNIIWWAIAVHATILYTLNTKHWTVCFCTHLEKTLQFDWLFSNFYDESQMQEKFDTSSRARIQVFLVLGVICCLVLKTMAWNIIGENVINRRTKSHSRSWSGDGQVIHIFLLWNLWLLLAYSLMKSKKYNFSNWKKSEKFTRTNCISLLITLYHRFT